MVDQFTILVISYYWPPAGGPGVQRVLKFVKYLPLFGIEPVILTVENGDYPAEDKSLSAEIPDSVQTFRVRTWEPYNLFRFFTGRNPQEGIPVAFLDENLPPGFQDRVSGWIRRNIFVPDARIGWVPFATRETKRILTQKKIDLVFSSGPPHSLHLIANRISKKYGLPWVADFRDPWMEVSYYQGVSRTKLTRYVDQRLERTVLTNANIITTVSPGMKSLLSRKVRQKQVEVIYNGYDESDFQNIDRGDQTEECIITYVGYMAPSQIPYGFLKALKRVSSENQQQITLHFVGKVHHSVYEEIKNHSLNDLTTFSGYVDHQDAITAMVNSTYLLLVIPDTENNQGIITGKLFEYLRAKTAIILLGPSDCDAAEIIRETNSGFVFGYNDEEGVTRLLRSKPSVISTGIGKYERKFLTQQLVETFKSVSKHFKT